MLRRRRAAIINKQSVPYGSTKVEYLESPSSSSNTVLSCFKIPIKGYKPGSDSIKLQSEHFYPEIPTVGQTEGCTLDGASFNIGYSISRKSFYVAYDGTTTHGYGDQYFEWSNTFGKWTNYSYELTPNSVKVIIDNETQFDTTISFELNVTTKQFYCFGRLSDHINYSPFGLYGKKKWMKFYCNDNLERHLIPSIDKTGTPCMFDLVSRKNFYNAGTGQFIYPTSSTTYSLRRPQAEWAKITDTGVHKIYHTPIGYEGSLEEYAIENGYKQLIETESPNEEGKYYSFKWVETDDTLTTEWFEVDPPQEEIFEENLDNPTE